MDRLGLLQYARRVSQRASVVFALAVFGACGCQSQNPTDPFRGRSTIPPPATNFAPPPGAQPYYVPPPVSTNTRPPAMQPSGAAPLATLPPSVPPNGYPAAPPGYPAQGYPPSATGYPAGYPNNMPPGVIAAPAGTPSWPPNTSPVGAGVPAYNSGSSIQNYPANRNPFAWPQQNPYANPAAIPTGYSPSLASSPGNGGVNAPGSLVSLQTNGQPPYTPPTASIPDNAVTRLISPRPGSTGTPSAFPASAQTVPVSTSVPNPPIVTIPVASVPPVSIPPSSTSGGTTFQEPRRLDNTLAPVDMTDLREAK